MLLARERRCIATDARRRRSDPSGTVGIQRRYEAEAVRRFRRLRALVIEAVAKLDVLGLRPAPDASASLARFALRTDATPPGARTFAFERSAPKIDAFMAWLREAQADEILSVQVGTPVRAAAERAWANIYIDASYRRGLRDAGARMAAAGREMPSEFVSSAFLRPIHADRVGLIYTRNYSALTGITEAMDTAISRTLAEGMSAGYGPLEMARELADEIDSIGITRARTMARTETVRANAEASLNAYEEAQIEGVEIEAEFSTAGDNAVCPECQELEGRVYSIEESRGVIPVHPNCRCAFLPVVNLGSEE